MPSHILVSVLEKEDAARGNALGEGIIPVNKNAFNDYGNIWNVFDD